MLDIVPVEVIGNKSGLYESSMVNCRTDFKGSGFESIFTMQMRLWYVIAGAVLVISFSLTEASYIRNKRSIFSPFIKLKNWFYGPKAIPQPFIPAIPFYYGAPNWRPPLISQPQQLIEEKPTLLNGEFPSIEEIGILLGTNSKEDTLKTLGEIASTEEGLYMMANFIKGNYGPPVQHTEFTPSVESIPPFRPSIPTNYQLGQYAPPEYQPIRFEDVHVNNGEPHVVKTVYEQPGFSYTQFTQVPDTPSELVSSASSQQASFAKHDLETTHTKAIKGVKETKKPWRPSKPLYPQN